MYHGLVYIVQYNGVVNVYDARTGEKKYQRASHLVAIAAGVAAPRGSSDR